MEALENGVRKITDAIKVTLGPRGRNVILNQEYRNLITNDGVTIAKEIELEDEFENMGAGLVKEVAMKTNEVSGDGTTTATILAGNMIQRGIKYVKNGANPVEIKRGMEKASSFVSSKITEMATKIESKEDVQKVASISSNDENVGILIADAIEKVGKDGAINVDESKTMATKLEIVDGMRIDKGYISSYMVTDVDKMEAILEKPYILVTDKKISQIQEILPVMELALSEGRKLLIIADDIESEVLTTLLVNKMRGIFTCVAIKAPLFGTNRKETLKDIACMTGATFVSEELGMNLKEVKVKDLGSSKEAKITKDITVIIGGKGNKNEINDRINSIRNLLEGTTEEYDLEILKERLAKLSGAVAVIKVGGTTETEIKEKKMRVEDAICATTAALEEGIISGGGTAYIDVMRDIGYQKLKEGLSENEKIGIDIVMFAMEEPIKQIAINAGKNGDIILQKIKDLGKGIGYDADSNEFVNMKTAGIIDPAKVTRCALENAVSIASIILTTDVMITGKEKVEQYDM